MNLIFRLRYHTKFGQLLKLSGNHPLLGNGSGDKAIPLQYLNEEFWQASISLPADEVKARLTYHYILQNEDGSHVMDWGGDRALVPAAFNCDELLVIDSWNDFGAVENAYYTKAFTEVLLKLNEAAVKSSAPQNATHTFMVKAPLLVKGQTICLSGEGPALGNWNAKKPLLLSRAANENYFSVPVDLRGQSFPLAYKYGVFDVERNAFVRFETGANRLLRDSIEPNKHTVVADGFAVLPGRTWKGAGVAIPVFSLRSEGSFGAGEFADLKPLADWCRKAGLKLIQILPVNDTTATHTWTDSYPYSAISAFALHPIYINLSATANTKNRKLLAGLEAERRRLNALDKMDYEAVMKAKLGFLRQIFPSQRAATFRSKDYKAFFADNEHWLTPYAAFSYLRDKFGTADFEQWPEHKKYDEGKIAALAKDNEEIAFHFFVQFHLHTQLKEAAAYAHSAGVVLKGDIAIGVSRHGADLWRQPDLFYTDMLAGAPPDPFAAKGQNWGFPTYNWPRMAADGFGWWRRRFAQMSNYFDAFRIDHILGFFRIWSIPSDAVEGILGRFVPVIPVEEAELAARGIASDRQRFTRPFITDAVLRDIFGSESGTVHRQFLKTNASGFYSMKPEFATQQDVEKHFARLEQSGRNLKIKTGLFDLTSNVILFETEGPRGKEYHFRLGMEQTTSFKYLETETQAKLRELYLDYFYRRQDAFWMREGMRKLPDLKRETKMLVCGEDLGMVPDCVPVAMKQLGLLSLEIQRMPKVLNREFSRPSEAPYLSVVTPSTHDMSTIRGWWEEDRTLIRKFFNTELGQAGEAPLECGPDIVGMIVKQHLGAPSMWSIFQLQDLLGTDGRLRLADAQSERINVPAIVKHYWRYRMHLTLEQLQGEEGFNASLRGMIRESGR